MKNICEGLPGWGHVLVWVLIFLWEFWIGKTKFGSTVEFVLETFASIRERFKNGAKK